MNYFKLSHWNIMKYCVCYKGNKVQTSYMCKLHKDSALTRIVLV